MNDLIALAERVEALTGPDREIDLLTKAAIFGGEARISPYNGEWCLYNGQDRQGRDRLKERPRNISHEAWQSDRYTASLDAAMLLKPQGWHVGYLTECNEDNVPHCCLTENAEPCRDTVGNGANMTLSLLAAALRAHAQGETK